MHEQESAEELLKRPTESGHYWAKWEDWAGLDDAIGGLWDLVRYDATTDTIYTTRSTGEYEVDEFEKFIKTGTPEYMKNKVVSCEGDNKDTTFGSGHYWAKGEDCASLDDGVRGLWDLVRYDATTDTIYTTRSTRKYMSEEFEQFIKVAIPEYIKNKLVSCKGDNKDTTFTYGW